MVITAGSRHGLCESGDRNRGLQALETALRMDPKTAEAKMALEILADRINEITRYASIAIVLRPDLER